MSSHECWKSINDMLIQNRCWLCKQTFQRGKQKKVFQVSDILRYYWERMKLESSGSDAKVGDTVNDSDAKVEDAIPNLKELDSENLRACFGSFCILMKEDSSGQNLKLLLKEYDIAEWMSGLVCGVSDSCREEASLFILDKKFAKPAAQTPIDAKDCPPGCGCDNPWPFLG